MFAANQEPYLMNGRITFAIQNDDRVTQLSPYGNSTSQSTKIEAAEIVREDLTSAAPVTIQKPFVIQQLQNRSNDVQFIGQLLALVKETNELKQGLQTFKSRMDRVCDMHAIEKYTPINQYLAEAPITNIFKNDTVGTIQIQNLSLMHSQYAKNTELHNRTFEAVNQSELSQKFLCKHLEKKHCAKNMCRSCYHQMGNSKTASKCPHKNKPNYAKGMCKNCYLSYYYESKLKNQRALKKIQKQQSNGQLKSKKSGDKQLKANNLRNNSMSMTTASNTPLRPLESN